MHVDKMSSSEWRAITSISSIMSLRMIGLFFVLPLFTLYASQLPGATPTLIGLAMGIYGLAQAIFQIPFGVLSDHFGRKPLILTGLLIFIIGSLVAGKAHSITFMIIGRALQGTGAIGSTLLALMADLVREEQRTKAMAISGISIGFSFSIAMFIGPILSKWFPINDLFFIAAVLGWLAIILLCVWVPKPIVTRWHSDTEPELKSFFKLLLSPELAKLNSGIFILHAVFTASFIVIPINLYHLAGLITSRQWLIYLPTLLVAFIICLFCIGVAEKKQQLKLFFLGGILTLGLAEFFLWQMPSNLFLTAISLSLFFSGFSLLEAFLPSLITRTAPASRKGSALGLYSCSQFLGIFVGGALGGILYGKYHFAGVYLFCIILLCFWFTLAFFMQAPRYLMTRFIRLPLSKQNQWDSFATQLRLIPGMVEVTFIAEEGIAYLKNGKRYCQKS